jgi:hypothetical protein
MNWWNTLSVFWKTVAEIVSGFGVITGGVAAFRTFRNWIIDSYDSPVLEFLRGREKVALAISLPGHVVTEPTTVTFMAQCLRRKPQRVIKSLMRLEKKDKVHQARGGWQFGPTPQRPNSDLDRWKKWNEPSEAFKG